MSNYTPDYFTRFNPPTDEADKAIVSANADKIIACAKAIGGYEFTRNDLFMTLYVRDLHLGAINLFEVDADEFCRQLTAYFAEVAE